MAQMEYTLVVYSSNGKGIVKHKVMVKDKKKHSIKDAMLIKVSFMHYVKWTRVVLPVAFREFEMVYIFFATFFFTIIVNCERSTSPKIWGGGGRAAAPSLPGFYGLVLLFGRFLFWWLSRFGQKRLASTDLSNGYYSGFL